MTDKKKKKQAEEFSLHCVDMAYFVAIVFWHVVDAASTLLSLCSRFCVAFACDLCLTGLSAICKCETACLWTRSQPRSASPGCSPFSPWVSWRASAVQPSCIGLGGPYNDGQRSLTCCLVLGTCCMHQSSAHARSSAQALVPPRGLIDI